MKKIGFAIVMIILAAHVSLAQSSEEVVVASVDGNTRVEGTDPFGAKVLVVYNHENRKEYQERTLDGVTTFVKYEKGKVVDSGTLNKPVVENTDFRPAEGY